MEANTAKRLYKSRTDRMIDGVCGGVAEYFNLDSTLVRIAWVLLTLFGGSGIILYILAMIIMPKNPAITLMTPKPQSSNGTQKFWGCLLIGVGALWLLSNLGFSLWRHWWWGMSWEVVLAVVLILAGVAFLFGGRNYVSSSEQPSSQNSDSGASQPENTASSIPPTRKLYRSRTERKLFGVCGGLAAYFGIDPTIVRLLLVVSAIASFGVTLFGYIIMAIVLREEPITAEMWRGA